MGYAFTYPLFKYIAGCSVGSYTHYPIISTDMIRYIHRKIIANNDSRLIAKFLLFSRAKIVYYKLFAYVSIQIQPVRLVKRDQSVVLKLSCLIVNCFSCTDGSAVAPIS